MDQKPANNEPGAIYFQDWQVPAALLIIFFCCIGIVVEILFVLGVRYMCGWKSNFSITILIGIAFCGLQQHLFTIIACITSLFNFYNWEAQFWIRLLGNGLSFPFFTIVVLNVSLTVHRLIYTLYPVSASSICTEAVCKIWLCSIMIFHAIGCLFLQFSSVASFRWIPKALMTSISKEASHGTMLARLNSIGNYVIGIFNAIAFPAMFLLLYYRKQLTFIKNRELKFTLHVGIVVVFEIFYGIFSESTSESIDTSELILLSTIVNISYSYIIVLPYIFLNGRIRRRICGLCGPSQVAAVNAQLAVSSTAYLPNRGTK